MHIFIDPEMHLPVGDGYKSTSLLEDFFTNDFYCRQRWAALQAIGVVFAPMEFAADREIIDLIGGVALKEIDDNGGLEGLETLQFTSPTPETVKLYVFTVPLVWRYPWQEPTDWLQKWHIGDWEGDTNWRGINLWCYMRIVACMAQMKIAEMLLCVYGKNNPRKGHIRGQKNKPKV